MQQTRSSARTIALCLTHAPDRDHALQHAVLQQQLAPLFSQLGLRDLQRLNLLSHSAEAQQRAVLMLVSQSTLELQHVNSKAHARYDMMPPQQDT